jgi:GNAT superfamily N-acetyltransferase
MNITIRSLAPNDRQEWEMLWSGYQDHYETSLPKEVTDFLWQKISEQIVDPNVFGIAAVDDETGQLLGICHYLFHASTWSITPYCYLEDLFTTHEARGHGVGRALIQRVVDEAAKQHSPKVYWQTHETNAVAQVLYNRVANRTGFMVYDINQ